MNSVRILCAGVLCLVAALPLGAQDKPADNQADLQKQIPALRDLDSHCPFTPPTSLDAWKARSAQVKLQMQVAMGLHPMPKLDPVEPRSMARSNWMAIRSRKPSSKRCLVFM